MSHALSRVKALVTAAGVGSRLRPITDTIPKALVPVGGRPLLDYWMDRLAAAGISDVLVNTHHLPEQIRSYIFRINAEGHLGHRFHMHETYEPTLLGSAGTIAANRAWADNADEVLIIYSDNLSGADLREMLHYHRSHTDPVTMLLFHAAEPKRCGIAEMDDRNRIVSFIEKPKAPKSDLANGGIYVVDADAYREMADMRAFDLGFDVLPRFVERMRGWEWGGYHLDIGTHEALARAETDLARGALNFAQETS
jgi:mannose-1-phosphate guanylyltransferase